MLEEGRAFSADHELYDTVNRPKRYGSLVGLVDGV